MARCRLGVNRLAFPDRSACRSGTVISVETFLFLATRIPPRPREGERDIYEGDEHWKGKTSSSRRGARVSHSDAARRDAGQSRINFLRRDFLVRGSRAAD